MANRPTAIVPVAKIDNPFARLLIYGDPGCGKTPLVGTSPRGLILNADPYGTVSAALTGSKCDRWDVRDHNDLDEAYQFFRHGGCDDYSWVWLDNATLFEERGLDSIMEDLIKSGKTHRKVYLPDRPEYGQNQNRIKLWVRGMTDLPINFGITAHVMRVEDEDGNSIMKPSIQGAQGKVSDTVCGYMGMVGYMYQVRKDGETRRGLQVFKDSKRVAKDRYGAVPNGKIFNPTIPKLEELIRKKLPEPPPPRKRPGVKRAAPGTVQRNRTTAQRNRRSA